MQAGGAAGTIYSLRVSDLEERGPQASLHELSLLAAPRFLPEPRKPEILILGVEPKIIEFGLELSPQVEAALPTVVQWVREQIYSRRFHPGSLNRFPSPIRSSRSVSGI